MDSLSCVPRCKKKKNPLISGAVDIIQHLFVELRVINFIKGYSASVGCHN